MVVGDEEVCVPGDPAVVGVCPGPPQDFLTPLALVCARVLVGIAKYGSSHKLGYALDS